MELRTEIEIDAPVSAVWTVLVDFAAYPDWNPFIPRVAGEPKVGNVLEVLLSPPAGSEMTVRPTLLVVEPNRELRWRGKLLFDWIFAGEHFFRLVEVSENRTRFVHGEDFSGILVRLLGSTLTRAARGFVFMNQALKKRAEGK
jgi:hypothetical protein